MEPQARGQGKGGKTGDNRCSGQVAWARSHLHHLLPE